MKAITAITLVGTLIAVPAFAGGGSYEKSTSTTTQSTTQLPPAGSPVIIEQQAVRPDDPRPQQGADNPSGNLGQSDLNREGSGGASTRIAPGVSHPVEDKPDTLDTQEMKPKSAPVVR